MTVRGAARCAPAATALSGSVLVALATGVSPLDLLRFSFATLWSVLLPGMVLLRWSRPRPTSLAGEVATGLVVGLGAQLIAWGGFVGIGGLSAGRWLALYPLLFVVAVASLPKLRARLRKPAYPQPVPIGAQWALCVAYLAAVTQLWATVLHRTPLPPGRGRWYQDLYWHLSISAEARHAAPPGVPQVAGEPLFYHWFANAHMAADSLVGGVDVLVVTARLWYLPVYAATIVLTYLLATRLIDSPWAGVLAVVLVVAASALTPVRWISAVGTESLIPLSPSQVFGLPVMLALVGTLVGIVAAPRGGGIRGGEWALLGLFAALSAGAKSSILPTVFAALLLVLVVAWWRRRSEPDSTKTPHLAPTLAAGGVLLAVLLPASRLLAGGSSGSTLGFLTSADQTAALRQATRLERAGSIDSAGLLTLAALIGVLLAAQFAGVLLAWPLRRDPRVMLLAGCTIAGFSALVVVHHPGGSQLYFMRGVMPLAAVLTACGAVHLLRRCPRTAVRKATGVGIAAGLTGWAATALVAGARQGDGAGVTRLALALLVLLICAAAIAYFLRAGGSPELRPRDLRPPWAGTAAVVALLTAVVVPSAVDTTRGSLQAAAAPDPSELSAAQIAGTTWLRQRTAATDVVATNVHCASGPTRPRCDSRAFWVTGLGERRSYVESWGYTDQSQATSKQLTGSRHVNYAQVPFFDQQRLQRNDAAFTAPTEQVLDELYAAGVRVLFADASAGPVSPVLPTLATSVFRDGGVSIYVLRPAR